MDMGMGTVTPGRGGERALVLFGNYAIVQHHTSFSAQFSSPTRVRAVTPLFPSHPFSGTGRTCGGLEGNVASRRIKGNG